MKSLRKILSVLMILTMLLLPLGAMAATTNPTPASPGYMILPFHLTGTISATTESIVSFNLPWPARLLNVYAKCRFHGGAPTIMVLNAGTSMFSTILTLTTSTLVFQGTLSSTAATLLIADEANITIDVGTPTGASFMDTTILLMLKRL